MKYVKAIPYEDDVYEVTVHDSRIVQVIKYIGDSQMPRPMLFDDLNEAVKQLILNAVDPGKNYDDI